MALRNGLGVGFVALKNVSMLPITCVLSPFQAALSKHYFLFLTFFRELTSLLDNVEFIPCAISLYFHLYIIRIKLKDTFEMR